MTVCTARIAVDRPVKSTEAWNQADRNALRRSGSAFERPRRSFTMASLSIETVGIDLMLADAIPARLRQVRLSARKGEICEP
jgi:hypothetical protein